MRSLPTTNTCPRCGKPKPQHTQKQKDACSRWLQLHGKPCPSGAHRRMTAQGINHLTRTIHNLENKP